MTSDLNLIVTDERIQDMSLETFYNLEGSPKATVDFVAWFVTDEDGKHMAGYVKDDDGAEVLDNKEAVKLVLQGRRVKDVEEIMGQLREAIEDRAVPKE
ncbi:MAG: hypothetical protein KAJ19_27880 [Gammaproteobacteria bacterium]|nr:hypothetical protein [Gammaproteobacteria bacterium]